MIGRTNGTVARRMKKSTTLSVRRRRWHGGPANPARIAHHFME
jgi:hypothetical protein